MAEFNDFRDEASLEPRARPVSKTHQAQIRQALRSSGYFSALGAKANPASKPPHAQVDSSYLAGWRASLTQERQAWLAAWSALLSIDWEEPPEGRMETT